MSSPFDKVLVQTAKRLFWAGADTRRRLNEAGVHILPANFYSTVPSVAEIEASFEYAEEQPYRDDSLFDAPALAAYLEELMPYAAEFDPPREGDQDAPDGYFWGSRSFGFSDAMSYWCMVRHWKPRRIVEVGCGHSTLIALQALAANGGGELVCVEPYPRDFLRGLDGVTELVERPVQELPRAWFEERLEDGDMLFIDSTHTVKTGSDCLHLYLRVLPHLDRHLMCHAHDVFLPQGYPKAWLLEQHIYWTEQYLLMALLLGNDDFRVRFGSTYHKLVNPDALDRLMGGKAPGGGGSFWFERKPRGRDAQR
ncbi:MAG: class I SAM-dependent methyltransferase [Planctomycetes bacterium]|nr:class I SAM-dependent methyltransferase [Planctomycetota bacterium]